MKNCEEAKCYRFCEKPLKNTAYFNLNYIEVYSRISALRRFSFSALVASRSLRAMHHRPFSKRQILKPIAIIMQNRMMKRQKQTISNKKDAVILNLLCIVPKRAEKPWREGRWLGRWSPYIRGGGMMKPPERAQWCSCVRVQIKIYMRIAYFLCIYTCGAVTPSLQSFAQCVAPCA